MKKINTKSIVRIYCLLLVVICVCVMAGLTALAVEEGHSDSGNAEQADPTAFSCCGTDPQLIEEAHTALVQKKLAELNRKYGQPKDDVSLQSTVPSMVLTGIAPSVGNVHALVIPITFPGYTVSQERYELLDDELFGTQENTNHFILENAVTTRDLLRVSSNGKLNFTGDVMPIYSAAQLPSYYNENDPLLSGLLGDAIYYYQEKGLLTDYTKYDANDDGVLDCVVLLAPNFSDLQWYSDATDNRSTWVTSMHSYFLSIEDNLEVKYGIFSRFDPDLNESNFYTLGDTVAHEYGHLMGLADHYVNNSLGVNGNSLLYGGIEVMGEYGRHFNPYYRYLLDWIEPEVLPYEEGLKEITLCAYENADATDMERAVILIPDATVLPYTEFYMAEYRTTVERGNIYYNGVMLWHVNAAVKSYILQYQDQEKSIVPVYKDGTTTKKTLIDKITVPVFNAQKDLYVTGDIFSSETSPSSDFYDGIYTGAYLEVMSMDSEKAVVKAGFVEPDLTPPPTITFGTPSATHVRDTKDTDYLYFPVKYENYDTMTDEYLFDYIEVITTGTVTVRRMSYSGTIMKTGEGDMFVNDLSGDGTVQLRILPGSAKNGAKYESVGALSPIVIVDNTAPVGTVSYSTRDPDAKEVVATLSVNEEIQPMDMTCTFTENGTYTFSFLDLAGNKGTVTATVDWMEYALFSETGNTVSAQLVFARENPPQDADLMVYAAYKEGNKLQYLEALTVSDMQTTFTVPEEYQNCEIELYVWGRDLKPCMAVQTYKKQ